MIVIFFLESSFQNQNPKLISSINCNYEVEWITEYACEADMLTTSDCKFSKDIHGIDLDLSVLTKGNSNYNNFNISSAPRPQLAFLRYGGHYRSAPFGLGVHWKIYPNLIVL